VEREGTVESAVASLLLPLPLPLPLPSLAVFPRPASPRSSSPCPVPSPPVFLARHSFRYNKAIKSDPECVAVLDGLLHKEERQRLGTGATGANEIRDTAWFKDCEWANMLEKTAKVPWVPKIKNKTDLSHFDLYDASDEQCLPYYGLCPWSKDF
jgi:hypothetical protein